MGCAIQAEIENILWADLVISQMPGWWMGAPWTRLCRSGPVL
ncbi:NAD(P)H-dependent oxidoreductase [Komagataeibacter melomenusus]|nr:NAD(P)H-dependent oxidoreductase [Komagataeibacter melomenusus]